MLITIYVLSSKSIQTRGTSVLLLDLYSAKSQASQSVSQSCAWQKVKRVCLRQLDQMLKNHI